MSNKLVKETWVRKGECNHCGWCCSVVSRGPVELVHEALNGPPVGDEYWAIRGYKWKKTQGRHIAVLNVDLLMPCPEHQEVNLGDPHLAPIQGCRIQDTKPQFCTDYPLDAPSIQGSPCSYWFEKGDQVAGGDGAPAEIVGRYKT